jgi:predicted HAD superfamily Cof-like phosphohydrolase
MVISQKQLYKANSDKLKNNSNLNIMKSIQKFLDIKTVNEIKRIKPRALALRVGFAFENYIETAAAYVVGGD